MNHLGMPALISSVLTASLALVAWTHRRHDRRNIALALFAGCLGLMSVGHFALSQCRTVAAAEDWFHFPLTVLPFMLGSIWYYMLVLTGHDRRLSMRVAGVPLWLILALGAVYVVFLTVVMQATDLMFSEVVRGPTGAYYLDHTEEVGYFFVGIPFLFVVFVTLFIKALRRAEPGPYRKFLLLNALGLVFMILSTPAVGAMTKHLSPGAIHFLFVGPTVACLVLYFALVSYQFDQVHQLNADLERKVEQRTLHLRQAQARLVQSQKMNSMGRLVAGVAHEFNNPIGAVISSSASGSGWIDRLERELARQPVNPKKLEKVIGRLRQSQEVITEGAERVAAVVQRLTAFARLDQAERKRADLDQCVDEALGLLPPGWDEEIEVLRRRPETPLEVICFPARLNQALQGVLENAVDALESGGRLTVTVAASGSCAEIAVADTGPGIPAELLEQIFDPGFTTKSRGIGTGLGLAVAFQVMEDHRGRVDVHSEEGEGATVVLRLPLDESTVDG